MIDRLMKIVLNKPTTIKGPIFTKDYRNSEIEINKLNDLLQYADDKNKYFIENDIKKLKYGDIGESNIYYELKNSFLPMMCLHNIRIEYEGMIAQIDFIVITPKQIYVLEGKNLVGDITINKDGEFIRKKKYSSGKVFNEGMYSPITQNERHINILRELLKNEAKLNKYKLERLKSFIVISNLKTIINKKLAPESISSKIIKHDNLVNAITQIENNKKIDWILMDEDINNISECLIKYNKKADTNYIKKYSITHKTNNINLDELDDKLRNKLKEYRLNVAKQENLKAYMVFNNESLEELIKQKPLSKTSLEEVKGFGVVKSNKYSNDIINIIKECI